MAQSVIGALRVVLGMDAGEFRKGSKESESRLDRLARKFGITAKHAKIAGAAMGAAVAGAAAAIGVAVNRSLGELDKLTKLSRSIGVPVEQMSSLKHAAELSGASIEELGRSFRNVARNMQGAAKGPTDFSRSLEALNIQWRDAEGNFIRADKLLLDVADRFAGMEDGAGKTALAMKIFGEEMGPRLVSMLNAGSGGIREMQAEAERLGITFDRQAGEAAERFNDTMDRIGKAMGSWGNQLTIKILPALEHISGKFQDWVAEGKTAASIVDFLSNAFKGMLDIMTRVSYGFERMGLASRVFFENLKSLAKANFTEIEDRNRIMNARLSKLQGDLAHDIKQIWADLSETQQQQATLFQEKVAAPLVQSTASITQATQAYNQAEQERARIIASLRDPYQVMIDQQTRLNELFGNSAAQAGILAKANQMAAFTMQNAYANAASSVSGALSNLFSESKGLAIANALINTYEAVTAALKNPPGPPFSYAYAAAALANGMAQVAAIRSTNKSGGGGGGSAAGVVGGGATEAATPQQQQSFSINLQGETFGREHVRGLLETIGDLASDGVVIRVPA